MRCLPFILLFTLLFINSSAQSEKSKKDYVVSFHLIDGSQLSGTWHSCSDSFILLSDGKEIISLTPEEIYKFEIRKSNSTKRNAMIGAGVGFAVGFLIGYNGEDADGWTGTSRVGHAAGAGLIGAFSGAFIGHLIGMAGKSYYVLGSSDQYKKIQPQLQKYNQSNSPKRVQ